MDRVEVKNYNESYIRVYCEPGLAYELRDNFSFMVPGAQFSPKFKAKIWDGRINLFDVRKGLLYRGLLPYLKDFCDSRDYEFYYEGEAESKLTQEAAEAFIERIAPKHTPRDYQVDAFVRAINDKRRLFLSPTSSGKSMMIYLMVRYFLEKGMKGIIIVPNVSLVEQLSSDFKEYAENTDWVADDFISRIFSDSKNKDAEKPLHISTWQSLANLSAKHFEQYDFVIGDEAHGFKAKSLVYIMTSLVNAQYRIGTTGTLDGTKVNKMVLEGLFGKEYVVTTSRELMDTNQISNLDIKCVLLKHSEENCKMMKGATYPDEIKYLVNHQQRNKFIKNLTLSLKNNTLVLFQFIEHGKMLLEMLQKEAAGRRVFFVYGLTDVEVREEVRRIVELEENAIIVASVGTFSTGINIKNLHNVIFASPSKARIRILQSIGRVLRLANNKNVATLYDIADDLRSGKKDNFTLKHFADRLATYDSEMYPYKIYKVDLKG